MAKKKCPLCQSQYFYRSTSTLCDRCDQIFKMGEKMEAQHETGESKIVAVGYRFFFENITEETSRPSENELLSILERLGLAIKVGDSQTMSDVKFFVSETGSWTIRIDADRVEALGDFLSWINRCISNAYQEGHEKGRDLLRAIANGDLSVNEINAKQMGKFKAKDQ